MRYGDRMLIHNCSRMNWRFLNIGLHEQDLFFTHGSLFVKAFT